MSQTFKIYLCSMESLKSLSIYGAPASLRAEDVQTKNGDDALWHSVRAFWQRAWCPKCGWSTFTFGPDEAMGTLVAWSGIVSVLIWNQAMASGSTWRMVLWKSAGLLRRKESPSWSVSVCEVEGKQHFQFSAFSSHMIWYTYMRSCSVASVVSDSVQRYEVQPARLLCP